MTFDDQMIADLRRTAVSRVCLAISHARFDALMEGFADVAERLHSLELEVAAGERPGLVAEPVG